MTRFLQHSSRRFADSSACQNRAHIPAFMVLLAALGCGGGDAGDDGGPGGGTQDTTPPTVTITTPADGASVGASLTITASASDDVGVARVEFLVDGSLVATDDASPYSHQLDTTTLNNGAHTIMARAYDLAGNEQSDSISVTVSNGDIDSTDPIVNITEPLNDATIAGQVSLSADASDNVGIQKVDFFVGGSLLYSATSSPYSTTLGTQTLTNGVHSLAATAFDAAGNSATSTISVTVANVVVDTAAPTVSIVTPTDGQAVSGSILVTTAASDDVAVVRVELSVNGAVAVSDADAPFEFAIHTSVMLDGAYSLEVTAYDAAGNSASDAVTVTYANEASVILPPDPVDVAPAIDKAVVTEVPASTEFLYTGPDPIQTGVLAGVIDLERVVILRGQVKSRSGASISGVAITILDHDEYGQTLSRDDGMFDIAVNGGGVITVSYRKQGYLPAQRQTEVSWRDFFPLPEVVLIPVDSTVSVIDLASAEPMQVARGSVVTDADGTRQTTIMIPQGTTAEIYLADGTTQTIDTLSLRSTEYTVGDDGPKSMPGALPPASGYTYAVELSTDESLANGKKIDGKDVLFNQPVPFYVDNFLDFPVGGVVPVGYYNNDTAAWIPYHDGLVIGILGSSNGRAEIDLDGSGAPADAAALAALNISDAEQEKLAALYQSGQSLWRVELEHLSTWDCNWPFRPPSDAAYPGASGAGPTGIPEGAGLPGQDDCDKSGGSTVGCLSQTLSETIPITGTSHSLNYKSNRLAGRRDNFQTLIPLSGATVPGSLQSIELMVSIAGKTTRQEFPAAPDQVHLFTWDGLDAYGRAHQGIAAATIKVGYTYFGEYATPDTSGGPSFGRPSSSTSITGSRGRGDLTLWQEWTVYFNGVWVTNHLAGWTVDAHHAYDSKGKVIYFGHGGRTNVGSYININTVAGNGGVYASGDDGPATEASLWGPLGVAVAPDGSFYIADFQNDRIRHVDTAGIITTVAGGGSTSAPLGDGGPATDARIDNPANVAVGPDGSLYIAQTNPSLIRRVTPDGVISSVAGIGANGFSGDGGPAVEAQIDQPSDVTVGRDGSIYIADKWNHRVRRVDPDGIISTVCGTGTPGYNGDNRTAATAMLSFPSGVAIGPDGSLYIADASNARIRKVSPSGIITTVAGTGRSGYSGDSGQAIMAKISPYNIDLDLLGNLYIADLGNSVVRRVAMNGIITTIAGNGVSGFGGDGGDATKAQLTNVTGVAIGPDNKLYIVDSSNNRIRRIVSPGQDYWPSSDGSELYVFDAQGRHQMTLNAMTGAIHHELTYDDQERLIGITDAYGSLTSIVRDAEGNPTDIFAPGGQQTRLTTNADGYLSSVTNPAGEAIVLTYGIGGLLSTLTRPEGNLSTFMYDGGGRLIQDVGPDGSTMTLERTLDATGYSVTLTTAMGRVTTYRAEVRPNGDSFSSITSPTGGTTEFLNSTDGLSTATYSSGTVVTLRYGPDPRFGLLVPYVEELTVTMPDGKTKTLTQSRTVQLADPFDPLSLVTYSNTGTDNGAVTTVVYEAATRCFTTTTPEGRTTVTELDAFGAAISTDLGVGVDPLVATFDALGRPLTKNHGAQSWSYAYDAKNRLTARTDVAGDRVQYAYDDADRIVRMTYPGGGTEDYGYDKNGSRTALTMPSYDAHTLSYTGGNLLSGYTPPGGGTGDVRTYNLDRELVSHVFPTGRTITNSFDSGGRWLTETYDEALVEFGYDGACCGQLMTLAWTPVDASPAQNIAYTYNGDIPTQVVSSGAANGTYTYTFGSDLLISSILLSSGLDEVRTTFTRDLDGKVTGLGPFSLSRGGPAGAVTQVADGNLILDITYDSLARVSGRHYNVGATALYGFDLVYNTIGKVVQKIETEEGVSHTTAYTYDADGQLQDVTTDGAPAESYSYDANGNRIGAWSPSLAVAATYDNQDRITDHGAVTYGFDDDGFLTSRGGDLFSYSARGELLSVVLGGLATIKYHYDGLRRRVGRTDTLGRTHQYLYGNPDAIYRVTAVRDPDGILTAYHYGEDGMLFSMQREGAMYYIASDSVGSPRVVANASGVAFKILRYDSFGQLSYDSDPGFEFPFGFAGGLDDPDTSLVRFGFRDYDKVSGRWMARDPVLYDGGQANLYVYVGNNPVSQRDPLGLWCVSASVYLGFGAGGETCCSGGSCSMCPQGGIGFGSGASIGEGDAKQDGGKARAEGGIECGPLSLGWGCEYSKKCGHQCDDLPGVSAGEGDASYGTDGGSVGKSAGGFDVKKGKLKCNIGLRAFYEGCASFGNPLN